MNMPSKLRKALGAVKDQTSISLAKVTNAANLEVIILKATTHDEIPMDERYVNEIVHLVSSNKMYAAACAQYIGKRIGKTKNWVVVLKSLMIILRIFQDGDPYFPREIFHAMKRGARILNLSGFKDDSNSSPWDYTAFVRTIALYLDERLDCFLTGKLQRRVTLKNQKIKKMIFNETTTTSGIKEMKPTMLLDRITYWQHLLDRAMGTKPTGSAKTNRLVQISLYAIVQESFDIYKDISEGLVVILDNFFKLPCKACISAFQACARSCKQFDELSSFYSFCVTIGVGRSSEYPKVQKISQELMEALQEFLKDQAANIDDMNNNDNNFQSPLSKHLLVSALRESVVGSSNYNNSMQDDEGSEQYGTPERYFETASKYASSQCTSLEDLMSATDAGLFTPSRFLEFDCDEQDEKPSQNNYDNDDDNDDIASTTYESCSNYSCPIDQIARFSLDLERNNNGEKCSNISSNTNNVASSCNDCWELVLVETAISTTTPEKTSHNDFPNGLFDQSPVSQNQYNPFLELEDIATVSPSTATIDQNQDNFFDFFEAPTFHAHQESSEATLMAPPSPTFNAKSSGAETDLALIFGDFNSKNSCATPPTFRAQESMENNIGLVPNFQAKNQDEMPTRPTFYSQGSFKICSAPTLNSQGSFKISSSSSSYQDHSSSQKRSTPTFNSQDSFKHNSTSNFQDHNSYQTNSSAPTLNSQGSFKLNTTTSTLSSHSSYQNSTTPTFDSQGSLKFNSTSTFEDHNSYQISATPTFRCHNAYQTSTASSFQGHNSSYMTNIAPTYPTSTEQIFQGLNSSYEASIEPTFRSHNSYQINTRPTFQHHSSFQTSTTTTTPIVHGDNSYQTSIASSFQGHNIFQTSITPTFRACNSYHTNTTAAPTFRAKLSNEKMMVGETKEDDLFGPWPINALTSNGNDLLNKSMQEQSLLQQQQTWLEQQNKIIAKHMT